MNTIPCAYCNEPVPVRPGFTSGELLCKSCGQSFFVEPGTASPSDTQPISATPPRNASFSAPPRKPDARPFRPAGEAIASSKTIVLTGVGFFIVAALLFEVLHVHTHSDVFFWLFVLVSSLFPVWFMAWVMIYVRAIALNSDR